MRCLGCHNLIFSYTSSLTKVSERNKHYYLHHPSVVKNMKVLMSILWERKKQVGSSMNFQNCRRGTYVQVNSSSAYLFLTKK